MPLKLGSMESLPAVLNKWAMEQEAQIKHLRDEVRKANLGEFTVKQVTRKESIKTSHTLAHLASTTPVLSGGFSYTSDGTAGTVTWTWTALQLLFATGETVTVGTGSNTISGLAAGTYYFYPYYSTLRRQIEWVVGTTGSPQIALTVKSLTAAQQQNLDNNIPVSLGGLTAIVPVGAAGSGSGGGSGCVVADQTVVSRRGFLRAEEVTVGDELLCRQGWTKVANVTTVSQPDYVQVIVTDGDSLDCIQTSRTHPFVTGYDDWTAAEDLGLSDHIIGQRKPLKIVGLQIVLQPCKVVSITCEPDHEFAIGHLLALTHNALPDK